MAEIVISEFMDEAAVQRLERSFTVHWDRDLWRNRDALCASIADARALIVRNNTQVDVRLLEAAPNLRAVGRLGVGLDNIDLETCRARNISVYPATGGNVVSVAEYVIAAALMLRRGAFGATGQLAAGEWPRQQIGAQSLELSGATFAIVGFGALGQAVARLARAFDCRVCAHDPLLARDDPAWHGVERTQFNVMLETCDIISIHVPLTDRTRNMFDKDALARMKRGGVLINTARGGIVDENALSIALREGHLRGAAIDVFAREPIEDATARLFAGLDNVILTPHIAGVTYEANERVSAITADNVLRALGARL